MPHLRSYSGSWRNLAWISWIFSPHQLISPISGHPLPLSSPVTDEGESYNGKTEQDEEKDDRAIFKAAIGGDLQALEDPIGEEVQRYRNKCVIDDFHNLLGGPIRRSAVRTVVH